MTGVDGSPYAQWYFAHCCGKPYDVTDPGWLDFFDGIADRLIDVLHPATALDAGCAMGILVGSLRSRGVDAQGVDISEYAVAHADPRAQGRVRVGSLQDPLPGRFDVVTCIEVLEHVEPDAVGQVIANLCSVTDTILLSTTPEDFNEGTHVNVRPPSYWLALFADQGFHRRFDVDASFVSPWAVLLERRDLPGRRLVAEYEAVLWELRRDNRGTRAALLDRDRRLAELEARLAELEGRLTDSPDRPELDRPELDRPDRAELDRRLAQTADRAAAAERELGTARALAHAAQRELQAVRASRRYRLGAALLSPLSALRRSGRG